MNNINDGLGDQPNEIELIEREEAEASREPVAIGKLATDMLARLKDTEKRARVAVPPLEVPPALANKRAGGAVGRIMGSYPLGSTDPLDDHDPTHVQRNISIAANAFGIIGYQKHPSVLDRWVSETNPQAQVEMGYVHRAVWVRAVWADTSPNHKRTTEWTKEITEWGTRSSREQLRDILEGLEELARRQAPAEVSERQEGPKERRAVGAVGFALLTPLAKLPTKTYADDAGFDLYVVEDTIVPAHAFVDVPLGVSVGLPRGVWGRITGRSSTLRRLGLLVNEGIIDTGYTGPLFAGVYNVLDAPVLVRGGDRVAQIILHRNTTEEYVAVQVDGHEETERGFQGFGSSGS